LCPTFGVWLRPMTNVSEQRLNDWKPRVREARQRIAGTDVLRDGDPSPAHDDATVCVITRFRLRHVGDLLLTYLDYRRVVRDARAAVGDSLIHAAFLVESLTTCYSLSIWRDEAAVGQFGTRVPRHVAVAGRVFRRLARTADNDPELWATQWRLIRSSNNLNWADAGKEEFATKERVVRGAAANG
jgi:hypothetical protein